MEITKTPLTDIQETLLRIVGSPMKFECALVMMGVLDDIESQIENDEFKKGASGYYQENLDIIGRTARSLFKRYAGEDPRSSSIANHAKSYRILEKIVRESRGIGLDDLAVRMCGATNSSSSESYRHKGYVTTLLLVSDHKIRCGVKGNVFYIEPKDGEK